MSKPTTKRPPSTRKRMILMLVAALVIFGGVFGIKAMIGAQTNKFFDNMPQPAAAVSATTAKPQRWSEAGEAVGTLVAVNGIDVTTEAGGVIRSIEFEAGQPVAGQAFAADAAQRIELALAHEVVAALALDHRLELRAGVVVLTGVGFAAVQICPVGGRVEREAHHLAEEPAFRGVLGVSHVCCLMALLTALRADSGRLPGTSSAVSRRRAFVSVPCAAALPATV